MFICDWEGVGRVDGEREKKRCNWIKEPSAIFWGNSSIIEVDKYCIFQGSQQKEFLMFLTQINN